MLCEHCEHEYYEIGSSGITCGECNSMLYEFDYDERVGVLIEAHRETLDALA